MDVLSILQFLAIGVTLFFFVVSSIFDIRKREVDDKVWLVYGPTGFALTAATLYLDPSKILLTVASAGVAIVLAIGLAYFGLFGGADAKAIICLGLTIPLIPRTLPTLLGYAHPFFPIVVLVTGFLCSALAAVWIGVANLFNYSKSASSMFQGLEHESKWRKGLAIVSGYPAEMSRLLSTFYLYPMEEITEASNGGRRSFKLFVDAEADRDKMVSEFSNAYSKLNYQGKVWVTPGLPMLVFMTAGLVLTLTFGDILFSAVFLLFTH